MATILEYEPPIIIDLATIISYVASNTKRVAGSYMWVQIPVYLSCVIFVRAQSMVRDSSIMDRLSIIAVDILINLFPQN